MTTIDLLLTIRIIYRTVQEAAASGCDYLGQTQKAALAVLQLWPDIPAHEALIFVQKVRHSAPPPNGHTFR